MNHRERVRTALAHKEPDRIPLEFGCSFTSSAEKDMQQKLIDILGLADKPRDDLATQTWPYMSPDTFRELYKPYFKEYVANIKKHCPNAYMAHHCCGSSFQLLDDLADIGIDIINPVQTAAVDMEAKQLAMFKKKRGLSFLGGIDLQYILPHGSRDEVREFVKNIINDLGQDGGYVLAACHTLPDDVKPENVITMFEAALEFGTYPLKE